MENKRLSNQEVFDIVAPHLIKQNKRSVIAVINIDNEVEGVCAYRGKGGLKCAAGILISDEEYSESFENKKFSALPESILNKFEDITFISRLQLIHDNESEIDWKYRLKYIANQYRLTYPDCLKD